ncbi:FAD-dependent oxidoreductase [Paractinoplanes rhizophilus]|uniref:FAD-dependent oxidoreductase n=1 Tax=Paractinoplanes rhizophilus TaxID=1416877 RepID=A0ABW2HKZ1_9ACTN
MRAIISDYDVIVCGAGAGGLTVAAEFGRQGRRVLLLDKLTDTVETFKGELLQPGSLVTLERLDALDKLLASGATRINRLVSTTADGVELCAMDYRWLPSRHNHCLTHTYKGILDNFIGILPASVEFRRGVSVSRAVRGDDGRVGGVEIRTSSGLRTVRAPLVVAADGHSSKLRSQLGIETSPIPYAHQVVAIDLTDVPSLASQATTFITPRGMRVMYPMPNAGGRLYLQIAKGLVNQIGKESLREWVDQAIAECPALAPMTEAIHRGLPGSRVLSARRFVAPEFYRDGMPLLGDAAHAVHPMAGQGMNAAIADAVALAAFFDEIDLTDRRPVDRALQRYAAKRIPEVRTLSEFSHRFADLFTDTLTAARYAKTRYVLRCHGSNERLCYKIMHNISGLGYLRFSALDRLQQVGFPDRHAHRLPAATPIPEPIAS